MKKQSLAWENLQAVLDSAGNAARKGTQQYFTPRDAAGHLSLMLPALRPCVADLQCGRGDLLAAAANSSTRDVIGLDIDPGGAVPVVGDAARHFACADLQEIYPLLAEVGWRADLFTLNPPFSLRWRTKTLHALSESDKEAVVTEWKRHAKKPTIDSVPATFLIALDRLTYRGEGFMICSQSAAERLITDDLARHVWLWLTVPNFFPGTDPGMEIAVLYFAGEPQDETHRVAVADLSEIRTLRRLDLRDCHDISATYHAQRGTGAIFRAARDEYLRLKTPAIRPEFNVWLTADGTIARHLTPFQDASGKVPRELVAELNQLHGQSPMALVVQKSTRMALLRAVQGDTWRVDPALVVAVESAVRAYDAVRAPFYPLNDVQRLGYLDEFESLACKKTLPGFREGHRYPITSRTIPIERRETRINLAGNPETIEVSGNELLIEIPGEGGTRHAFTFDIENRNLAGLKPHDLQTLIEHFDIPAVPDIATLQPDRYAGFLADIDRLEADFPLVSYSGV
jgi:predicted RNA methylase